MTTEQAVNDIIAAGRCLYQRGLTAGTDGNISVRCGDTVFITASGVSKGRLTAADIVPLDLDGRPLTCGAKPSSEAALHIYVYRNRPDVGAVVHAHPPFATAYALAGKDLPQDLVEARLMLGKIPLLPFAEAGTLRLAEQAGEAARAYRGALLADHGAAAWDRQLETAVCLMEAIEQVAKTSFYGQMLRREI
ncbi:MAG: class II aldolase/adducin family protein [Firmicutes bacterium]|nr:class II aldolase/adducin family protein [Bacillota bacterium]